MQWHCNCSDRFWKELDSDRQTLSIHLKVVWLLHRSLTVLFCEISPVSRTKGASQVWSMPTCLPSWARRWGSSSSWKTSFRCWMSIWRWFGLPSGVIKDGYIGEAPTKVGLWWFMAIGWSINWRCSISIHFHVRVPEVTVWEAGSQGVFFSRVWLATGFGLVLHRLHQYSACFINHHSGGALKAIELNEDRLHK